MCLCRLFSHTGDTVLRLATPQRPLTDEDERVLANHGIGFGSYQAWGVCKEDPAFTALLDPPCGLTDTSYRNAEQALLRGLRGKVPLLFRAVMQSLLGKGRFKPPAASGIFSRASIRCVCGSRFCFPIALLCLPVV